MIAIGAGYRLTDPSLAGASGAVYREAAMRTAIAALSLPSLSLSLLVACTPAGLPGDDAGPNDPPPPDPCARALDEVASGTELLRFQGGDPYRTVHLERVYDGAGVGESSLFRLVSFALGQGEECLETRDAAALSYENSHHNWADRASAVLDDVRYTAAIDYAFGAQGAAWRVTLSGVDEASGEVVLEEQELQVTGAPLACWSCPGALPVWITEVLPENDGASHDEAGDADPWLELWNPSGDAVDLDGWKLTLSGAGDGTFVFPTGTSIERHGHLVVWLDGEPSEGGLHAPFALPVEGGKLGLTNPDGVGVGERTFSSPGSGRSRDLDLAERAYVVSDAPTPGDTSALQE